VRRPQRRWVRLGRWRHHPLAYWSAVTALAVTTAILVTSLTSEARSALDAFGTVERVAVARQGIDAGQRIYDGDIAWRDLPSGVLPDQTATDVVGRRAAAPIHAGEPIVDARLAPDGVSPLAAQVPAGRQAMALPLDTPAPPLEVGDRVDVWAVFAPGPTDIPADRVARRAPVVAVTDEAVTVALVDDEVAPTALALRTGSIVIALDGPPK